MRKGEPVDEACRKAQRETSRRRSGRSEDSSDPRPVVSLPGGSVQMPDAPVADVDARAELLANMALVKRAMEAIADADPLKIVQLSKRHSELVAELLKVTGAVSAGARVPEEGDPFAFLGDASRGPAPPSRKSS